MATSNLNPHSIASEVIRQNRFGGILLVVFYGLLATILGAYLVLALGQRPHSHIPQEPSAPIISDTQ